MKYDVNRFVEAQKFDYDQALAEIRAGRKESHWIWYIFPQLKGLGMSSMAEYYGIDGLGEAVSYMENDLLKSRLLEISKALLENGASDPLKVMGFPDNLKLQSCMTLFAAAAPQEMVFQKVLDRYYNGEKDPNTVRLLGADR